MDKIREKRVQKSQGLLINFGFSFVRKALNQPQYQQEKVNLFFCTSYIFIVIIIIFLNILKPYLELLPFNKSDALKKSTF